MIVTKNDMNSTEMITNSSNAFSFIDGLKFLPLILLATSVITSCLGKDGYMTGMPKLTLVLFSASLIFLILSTNLFVSLI